MYNNAVLTVCIGESYERMAKISHPTIKAYADKIGAEFVVMKETSGEAHYEKLRIGNLLNEYRRILYVDTDAIIREDCPDIFGIVPEHEIGMFNEGEFADRKDVMKAASMVHKIGIDAWRGDYYNTGVMVVSRMHKGLFMRPKAEDIYNHYEQSWLNLLIHRDNVPVFRLEYKFNRMKMMDKLTGEHRLRSYVVHYAGILNGADVVMSHDVERWRKGEHLLMRRHVCVGVGARLGDVVCAEPIARYVVEKAFPDAKVMVMSPYPNVFGHLANKATIVGDFSERHYKPDTPYLTMNAMVPRNHPIWNYVSERDDDRPLHMNTTDFMSLLCLKRTLPDEDKRIRLQVTADGVTEVMDVLSAHGKVKAWDDLIVVHPGCGWKSKTFPVEYWNNLISELASSGFDVAIIGKDGDVFETDDKDDPGVADVDIPDGVVDARNLLSINGLTALLSRAAVLISNDSAPVHVAGAFDNLIILLPTCKHPDHVFPKRKNDELSVALYESLICDDPDGDPSSCLPSIKRIMESIYNHVRH